MKKLLFLGVAVLAMAFVSCETKTADNAEATDSTKVEAAAPETPAPAAADPATTVATIKGIVEKAKAEGANWTADQWKENLNALLVAYKPFAEAFSKILKDAESGNADMEAAEKLEKDYEGVPEMVEEFAKLAKESANGKDLVTEEALKKTMEEMQIPELK